MVEKSIILGFGNDQLQTKLEKLFQKHDIHVRISLKPTEGSIIAAIRHAPVDLVLMSDEGSRLDSILAVRDELERNMRGAMLIVVLSPHLKKENSPYLEALLDAGIKDGIFSGGRKRLEEGIVELYLDSRTTKAARIYYGLSELGRPYSLNCIGDLENPESMKVVYSYLLDPCDRRELGEKYERTVEMFPTSQQREFARTLPPVLKGLLQGNPTYLRLTTAAPQKAGFFGRKKVDESNEEQVREYPFQRLPEFSRMTEKLIEEVHSHVFGEWEVETPPQCEEGGVRVRRCRCGEEEREPIPPLKHDFRRAQSECRAARCEEDGVDVTICANCGKRSEVVLGRLGHNYAPPRIVASTCAVAGKKTQRCVRCNQVHVLGELLLSTEHTYGEWKLEQTATCEQDGTEVRICKVCGKEDVRSVVHSGHSFGEWQVVREPGIEIDGEEERICKSCGIRETRPISAIVKTWQEPVTQKPSCTEDGQVFRICKETGEKDVLDVLAATGHIFSDWRIVQEATCNQAGSRERVCSVCGAKEEETVLALAHIPARIVAKKPCCDEDGYENIVCSACGCVLREQVSLLPRTGHRYGEWRIVREPEQLSDGLKERCCSVCGERESATIATAEPQPVKPTCVSDGVIYSKSVDSYGCAVYKKEVVPAKGHAFGLPEEEIPATEESEGTLRQTCRECGYVKRQKIPRLVYDWRDETTQPTCEQGGTVERVCVQTKARKLIEELPALGHVWGDWGIQDEPTFERDGSEVRSCGRCGKEEIRPIPMKVHQWGDEQAQEPTCTKEGVVYRVCAVSGEHQIIRTIPELGHAFEERVVKDQKGKEKRVYVCTRCGLTQMKKKSAGILLIAIPAVAAVALFGVAGWSLLNRKDEPFDQPGNSIINIYESGGAPIYIPTQLVGTSSDVTVTEMVSEEESGVEPSSVETEPGSEETAEESLPEPESERTEEPSHEETGLETESVWEPAHSESETEETEEFSMESSADDEETAEWTSEVSEEETEEETGYAGEEQPVNMHTESGILIPEQYHVNVGDMLDYLQGLPAVDVLHPIIHIEGTGNRILTGHGCLPPRLLFVEADEGSMNVYMKMMLDYLKNHPFLPAEEPVPEETTKHEHQFEQALRRKEAGCLSNGYVDYECACGETKREMLKATGHSWKVSSKEAATCTTAGSITYTCSCGQTKSESIPATGHSWTQTGSTPATCTTAGTKAFECGNCGETKTEEGAPATGHSWTVTTETPANCVTAGTRTSKCTGCGETKTETTTPATGAHSWNVIAETPANCVAAGTRTLQCSVCGTQTAENTTPATGIHNWVLIEQDVNLTYQCSVCGQTRTEPNSNYQPPTQSQPSADVEQYRYMVGNIYTGGEVINFINSTSAIVAVNVRGVGFLSYHGSAANATSTADTGLIHGSGSYTCNVGNGCIVFNEF